MTALPTPAIPNLLDLHLPVRDLEVIAALLEHANEGARTDFALASLRVGVLASRQATAHLDAKAIHDAGDQLLRDVSHALDSHGTKVSTDLSVALQRYLDPNSGVLDQRLTALVSPGGELARMLQTHVGQEHSTLAATLTKHLGESSPLFRLLSPSDASGLKAQLERSLAQALEQQRARILEQFSLDQPGSALSRLVNELNERNAALLTDVSERVDAVVGEFSLDDEASALSRLVRRVEQAQRAISKEFTLDEETSALSRIRRELTATLTTQTAELASFKAEIRTAIEVLHARKLEARRSTRAGLTFEDRVGEALAAEASRSNDTLETLGHSPGAISRCKVGDFVVTVGAEQRASGARIVWEAKAATSSLKGALNELEIGRRNREAGIGLFVFERSHAPDGFGVFERHGNDLVLAWDPEDPNDEVILRVAYSAAKAIALQQVMQEQGDAEASKEVTDVVNVLHKQLELLDAIVKSANTAKAGIEKVLKHAEQVREALGDAIENLDGALASLR